MAAQPPRTPEQLRNDRRAGFGCSGLLVLAGIAFVFGGISLFSNKGEATQARILDCDFRVPRQPQRCRGIWSVDDRFVQGPVDGASSGDVGKRIDVHASGDSASADRGRSWAGVAVLGLALCCVLGGAAMANGVRKQPRGPG